MDRPLAARVRRLRTGRRAASALSVLALVIVAVTLLPGLLRPSVSRTQLRLGTVTVGPVAATVSATGRAVPAFEHVVPSPITSRIVEVRLMPGDSVRAGDRILVLDLGETERAIERLEERVALKENEREQARIDLAAAVGDLNGTRRIRDVEIESLRIELEKQTKLVAKQLATEDAQRRAEVDLERARIQRDVAVEKIEFERRSAATALAGLDLEISILEKDIADASARLRQAEITADRDGIVTFVKSEIGGAVQQGDEVARIADLSRFRIEATLSDTHVQRVATGQPAVVRVGDIRLDGHVSHIRPTVEGGAVHIDVALEEPRHEALRHNRRVDVHIVTEERPETLYLPRTAFVTVDGTRALFVLRGDRAVRTPVEFGIASFERQEITGGLSAGDEVILSDMSDYTQLREVRLR